MTPRPNTVISILFLITCTGWQPSSDSANVAEEPTARIDPEGELSSVRGVWFLDGRTYVAVSRAEGHDRYQDELSGLRYASVTEPWTDQYGQSWSSHKTEEFAFIPESAGRNFVVLYPAKVCTGDGCKGKTKIYTATVKGAAIFNWGCTNGLVPVFDLGELPVDAEKIYAGNEWGTALEVSKWLGEPELYLADSEFRDWLPENTRRGLSSSGSGLRWDTFEYDVVVSDYFADLAGGYTVAIVRDRNTHDVKVMNEVNLFGGRC